jgi:hypothetical protein
MVWKSNGEHDKVWESVLNAKSADCTKGAQIAEIRRQTILNLIRSFVVNSTPSGAVEEIDGIGMCKSS